MGKKQDRKAAKRAHDAEAGAGAATAVAEAPAESAATDEAAPPVKLPCPVGTCGAAAGPAPPPAGYSSCAPQVTEVP